MSNLAAIVSAVRENAQSDYVGMWEIHALLREDLGEMAATPERMVAVVRELLERGHMLGDFEENVFHQWTGTHRDQLRRLHSALVQLGRSPDIGEVAWLAKR